eukprot:316282-Pyramimonas_sp.AAC.1
MHVASAYTYKYCKGGMCATQKKAHCCGQLASSKGGEIPGIPIDLPCPWVRESTRLRLQMKGCLVWLLVHTEYSSSTSRM